MSIETSPNSKSRLAIIIYGGFSARGGGVFTHVRTVERELKRRGWRVRIITLDTLPLFLRFFPHIVEKFFNFFAMPLGFFYKGRLTRFLYRLIIREVADLYIFEDIYLSWPVDGPAVTFLHAIWSDNLQAYCLEQGVIDGLVSREAAIINQIEHRVVTVSFPYRNYLEYSHFRDNAIARSICVVELGLDIDKFPLIARPVFARSMIFCGSLEARKNLLFMLQVLELVSEVDPTATLTIIGDGPDRRSLEKVAYDRQLSVNFKGRLSNDSVIDELQRHSIYLHSSIKESFSLALLEAKLCGLTTCALSDLQVPNDFIDLGFESFDARLWARAILSVQQSTMSPKLREFSARRMVDSILDVACVENVSGV